MFLPSTLLYRLLDCPALPLYRYTSLQYLIYAGTPMSVDRLKEALSVFGPVMAQGFGQAEAPFFRTILTPQEHCLDDDPVSARRLSSCGRAAPFIRVRIMDDQDIAPSEIEQVLWSHAAVADCAVIGVPDARWGEAIKAIVELKRGQVVSAEELAQMCRDRLGSIKTPKSIEFWHTLPRSAVGKVLKREIRAKF